ncbi:MAG: complex I subunit 5 family protein [Halanaerobiales bacterium]
MDYIKDYFIFDQLNIILVITGMIITLLTLFTARLHLDKGLKKFYLLSVFYVISFILIIFTRDWLVFFVAWEMVTVTTSLMLLWKDKGLSAQYLIIQFAGSSILLFAILMSVRQGYTGIEFVEEFWLQILLIIGLGTKSALFGLHFWLPSIYLQAPVTFNAISSGWVVKLGFIIMARLIQNGNSLLLILGFIMIFYGGIKALSTVDLKLILSYSSISQLGYIALGIGAGTIYGYTGSILHIILHGLIKTGLFLSAGYIINKYGSSLISKIKNLWYRSKGISLFMIFCFLALSGVPFLAVFYSKYLIKYGLQDGWLFTYLLYTGSLLTVMYSIRSIYFMFLKDSNSEDHDVEKEGKVNKEIRFNRDVDGSYSPASVEYLVFISITVVLLTIGLYPGFITNSIQQNMSMDYNYLKGLMEILVFAAITIIVMKRINWMQDVSIKNPSLDPFFNKVNKIVYNGSRYLYMAIYKDFQYQLLYITLLMFVLFIFVMLGA